MKEVDTQRQLQAEADEERAQVAFAGADSGRQQGDSTPNRHFFCYCFFRSSRRSG